MVDTWKSLVDRTCETCRKPFQVQYQTIKRGGGRFCSQRCNPNQNSHVRGKFKSPHGHCRTKATIECATCKKPFQTMIRNTLRGGGRYCSRQCNPSYWPRFSPTEIQRRTNLKSAYGLSIEQYDSMVAAQNGRCVICDEVPGGRHKKLYADHNHKTGKVRQLLCMRCNMGIGFLRDRPDLLLRAAEYLSAHDHAESEAA
jgi:hypothetical protein